MDFMTLLIDEVLSDTLLKLPGVFSLGGGGWVVVVEVAIALLARVIFFPLSWLVEYLERHVFVEGGHRAFSFQAAVFSITH